jgi:hypothetical protein
MYTNPVNSANSPHPATASAFEPTPTGAGRHRVFYGVTRHDDSEHSSACHLQLPQSATLAPFTMKSVLTGYTLSLAAFIPRSGGMADRF